MRCIGSVVSVDGFTVCGKHHPTHSDLLSDPWRSAKTIKNSGPTLAKHPGKLSSLSGLGQALLPMAQLVWMVPESLLRRQSLWTCDLPGE